MQFSGRKISVAIVMSKRKRCHRRRSVHRFFRHWTTHVSDLTKSAVALCRSEAVSCHDWAMYGEHVRKCFMARHAPSQEETEDSRPKCRTQVIKAPGNAAVHETAARPLT